MGIDVERIRPAVLDMLRINMGLQAGESVLVITDVATPEQWQAFPAARLAGMSERSLLARHVADIAARELGSAGHAVRFFAFPATGRSGTEPGEAAVQAMRSARVVIALTSFSLTHTHGRAEACRAGARVASMPGFTAEMLEPGGPMAADYRQIAVDCETFARRLSAARTAIVRNPAGTDITFSLEGREGQSDHGLYTHPGDWGNLPAGEAYTAPLEGTARGRIVVEPGWHPELDEPMQLLFEHGEAVDVQGGGQLGQHLRELLAIGQTPSPEARARRTLAELGIGTNPNAHRTDITLESEKIKGTVHLAIGDSSHMGGKTVSDLHMDFVLPRASLILDGDPVIAEGRWRIA